MRIQKRKKGISPLKYLVGVDELVGHQLALHLDEEVGADDRDERHEEREEHVLVLPLVEEVAGEHADDHGGRDEYLEVRVAEVERPVLPLGHQFRPEVYEHIGDERGHEGHEQWHEHLLVLALVEVIAGEHADDHREHYHHNDDGVAVVDDVLRYGPFPFHLRLGIVGHGITPTR